MKHGLPGRAGRRDPVSSVAQIALLFALPASLSRTRPSHPVSAWSFRDEFLHREHELAADVPLAERAQRGFRFGELVRPVDRRLQLATGEQVGERLEVRLVELRDEELGCLLAEA